MNEFDQHFSNACAKMAKVTLDVPPKQALDNAGLDGKFLLDAGLNEMGSIPQEQHFAFGMLLGIFYEQLRNSDTV